MSSPYFRSFKSEHMICTLVILIAIVLFFIYQSLGSQSDLGCGCGG